VAPTTIQLCGSLAVCMCGRRLELPGRQGRAVFAYLALNRSRPVVRDELLELLWPARAPQDPGESLSALLSRVRRVLGADVLAGRRELRLALPADATIDWESADEAVARTEGALAKRDWHVAWEAACAAADIAARGFLAGDELPWIEDRRRDLESVRLTALEALATAGLELGGAEHAGGERAARELVVAAPFRESGHRLLMTALAARGEVAEALQVYDRLRLLLREELGTAPAAAVQELHRRLLDGGAAIVSPGPPAPADERKLVSVLCAELAVPAGTGDPEELRVAVTGAHDRFREVVERFGGSVRRPAEGPVIALFGVPAGHEDDAQRAVRAAREACERRLVLRAAVATGESVVGGEHQDATGAVFTRVRGLLERSAAGELAVDSSAERAIRPAPRRSRMIGRVSELAALEAMYDSVAAERRPRFVLVMGHAGVGKSRLVEELLDGVERAGAAVHRGRCAPLGEGGAHRALCEVLWEAADIALDDSGSVAARKLADLAKTLRLDEATTAALAVSAGIALPGHTTAQDATESLADEIALAWPALLSALTASSPVVVAIEDLHWAEPALLEMLERIRRRVEGRLLLAATARPEFIEAHPAWSGAMSQVFLEPLAGGEAGELVDDLLPTAAVELRDRVAALGEGNPFFIEELARHVGSEGEPGMPHTVRALLAARIDSLPAAEKTVLQHASVVGRRFWAPALEPNRTGRPLLDVLRALEDRGLVFARPVSSLPGQREFWFAHGLTREVAYRSIPRGARARTHAAVAAWLERLAGDRRAEFIHVLAHHYEAAAAPGAAALAWPAGSPEPESLRAAAVRALLDAGAAARRGLLAYGTATRYADRAFALAASDRERLEAIELRARSFHAAVRGDDALAAYLEAIELARKLGDTGEAARLRAHAVLLCSRYMGGFADDSWTGTARELVEHGLQETDDAAETFEAGALLLARGSGRWRWGDAGRDDPAQARRDIERALAIADAIGSNYLRAYALEALTWRVFEQGLCDAEPMGERLVAAAGSLSNRVEAHESLCVAAICFARARPRRRSRWSRPAASTSCWRTRSGSSASRRRRGGESARPAWWRSPAGRSRCSRPGGNRKRAGPSSCSSASRPPRWSCARTDTRSPSWCARSSDRRPRGA
jgi:DNA-binding SARP family transcriptional activator